MRESVTIDPEGLDELFYVPYDIQSMNGPEIFVPQLAGDRTRFSTVRAKLPSYGLELGESRVLFRVRRNDSGHARPHPSYEMRGNPQCLAGRANFKNEAALYCSEGVATAFREARAEEGEWFTIAELRPSRALTVVDVAGVYAYTDLLSDSIGMASLWMSDPVTSLEERESYWRTRLFASIVRQEGFGGIRFSSSVDPTGRNVVVFHQYALDIVREFVERYT